MVTTGNMKKKPPTWYIHSLTCTPNLQTPDNILFGINPGTLPYLESNQESRGQNPLPCLLAIGHYISLQSAKKHTAMTPRKYITTETYLKSSTEQSRYRVIMPTMAVKLIRIPLAISSCPLRLSLAQYPQHRHPLPALYHKDTAFAHS